MTAFQDPTLVVPYKPLIWAFTWPYYHSFCFYTYYPILAIANCDDSLNVATLLIEWRKGKLEELIHVKIASTISAAAILAIFSWPSVEKTFWVAKACWYACLVLSLWALIISSQHAMLLNAIATPLPSDKVSSKAVRLLLEMVVRRRDEDKSISNKARNNTTQDEESDSSGASATVPNWKMIWIWQSSGMLMGYAWVFLLVGMTLHVCTPLIQRAPWGDETKIAIVFLSVATASFLSFTWGSYGIYRNPIDHKFEVAEKEPGGLTKDIETVEVLILEERLQ